MLRHACGFALANKGHLGIDRATDCDITARKGGDPLFHMIASTIIGQAMLSSGLNFSGVADALSV